jgi:hypothetical protein
LSRVSPGHLYYLFLDISITYVSTKYCKKNNLDNQKTENMEIEKPRFTNKSLLNEFTQTNDDFGRYGTSPKHFFLEVTFQNVFSPKAAGPQAFSF